MKISKLAYALFLVFPHVFVYAQEPCGTMSVLKTKIANDSSLATKMILNERRLKELITRQGTQVRDKIPVESKTAELKKESGTKSLCAFFNVLYMTISAPTVKNQVVSPSPNCVYGGEYVRVTGLIAGHTYRISTCGVNNFDTQLTVYTQGGVQAVAHNDDWCGSLSEIYFTPLVGGDYDVQITEFNCMSNSDCSQLEVELWNIPTQKIVIPVVVHVLNYGEPIGVGRNISAAQVNSQIAALNQDFRRLNSDLSNSPAAFRGASMDPLIEFCLAQQDEDGMPTTGITRPMTNYPTVTKNALENTIKPNTIWDRNKYLNIWVADFDASEAGLLGYSQFSGMAANTDGVAIRYSAFGTTGSVTTQNGKGRTTTHEIGHWLNLRHIWGDDNDCSGTDQIADTPDQEIASYGSPTFPLLDKCTVDYPGVMFQNFMDYTDDVTMNFFTYGQVVVMHTTLISDRSGLLTSPGCLPSTIFLPSIAQEKISEIYPNPTAGTINIDFIAPVKETKIQILNSLGSVVRELVINESDHAKVDLSMLSKGVYFVNVGIENTVGHYRVILE